MTLVDDAFAALKANLEITDAEQHQASARHIAIRDHIRAHWDLEDDFLTGSYRRNTKTKPLRDVDIFVVVDADGDEAALRQSTPADALGSLQTVLKLKYDRVTADVFACVVEFGPDDHVVSFDVAPAFKRSTGGYLIPDTATGTWIATNPKLHHEATTAKNKACSERWVPLVKMVKGANRHTGEPIPVSFLIEVMALELVRPPMKTYQHEFTLFCANPQRTRCETGPIPLASAPP